MASELKFTCDALDCRSVDVAMKLPLTDDKPKEWFRVEIGTAKAEMPLGTDHKSVRSHACSISCAKRIIHHTLVNVPDGWMILDTQVYTFRLVHKEDSQ